MAPEMIYFRPNTFSAFSVVSNLVLAECILAIRATRVILCRRCGIQEVRVRAGHGRERGERGAAQEAGKVGTGGLE